MKQLYFFALALVHLFGAVLYAQPLPVPAPLYPKSLPASDHIPDTDPEARWQALMFPASDQPDDLQSVRALVEGIQRRNAQNNFDEPKLLERSWYGWNVLKRGWQPTDQTIHEYNELGQEVRFAYRSYDLDTRRWQISNEFITTYDAAGRPVEMVTLFWPFNPWEPEPDGQRIRRMKYDENDRIIETVILVESFAEGNRLGSQFFSTYDANGCLLSSQFNEYDPASDSFLPRDRTLYTRDVDCRIETVDFQGWNALALEFQTYREEKIERERDARGNIVYEAMLGRDRNEPAFTLMQEQYNRYDAQGRRIYREYHDLISKYGFSDSTAYDNRDNVIYRFNRYRAADTGGEWVNTFEQFNTFNRDDQLIIEENFSQWNTTRQDWDWERRTLYEYDERGNMTKSSGNTRFFDTENGTLLGEATNYGNYTFRCDDVQTEAIFSTLNGGPYAQGDRRQLNRYSPADCDPDHAARQVRIYPNPASGELNLLIPAGARDLRIIDLTGRRVWAEAGFRGGFVRTDVSKLPVGLYLLQMEYEGETLTEKLIIGR